MTDPYKVLGVSPNASDEEVKAAYRKLAKKYHPDNYANSPLADLADEKMKEVNEAYDTIMNERKHRSQASSANRAGGYQYGGYGAGGYSGYGSASQRGSHFSDVRQMIQNGRIADAEQTLDGVPSDRRSAEWYFLKGMVLHRRGWMDEAYNYVSRAVQMDPGNQEYRMALSQLQNQRGGMYGGYNPYGGGAGMSNACCSLCAQMAICQFCCTPCDGGADCSPC